MTFGTFDMLHEGHKNFLKQAKEKGDKLIVVVARNSNVLSSKGEKPFFDLKKRIEGVKELNIADLVIEGRKKDIYKVIWELQPDIICLGYDQEGKGIEEEIKRKKLNIQVIRLKPYKEYKYKSSLFKNMKKCQSKYD